MSQNKFLTREEEYKQAVLWRDNKDVDARNKIIEAHQGVAKKIAGKYHKLAKGLKFDDLVNIANIGMLKAAEKYDPDNERKARFATYATYLMRAEIQLELAVKDSLILRPNASVQRKLFSNLGRATADVRQKFPEYNSYEVDQEVARRLNTTPEIVQETRERLKSIASLDVPLDKAGGGGESFVDYLEGNSETGEEAISAKDSFEYARRIVLDAMERLNDREKDIVKQRKLQETPATLEELSEQYGLTRERVRQIEVGAWKKILKDTNAKTGANVTFKDLPKPDISGRKRPSRKAMPA